MPVPELDEELLAKFLVDTKKRCKFGRCLDAMSPKGQATVLRARELKVPVNKIHTVLKREKTLNLPAASGLAHHFAGTCGCAQ